MERLRLRSLHSGPPQNGRSHRATQTTWLSVRSLVRKRTEISFSRRLRERLGRGSITHTTALITAHSDLTELAMSGKTGDSRSNCARVSNGQSSSTGTQATTLISATDDVQQVPSRLGDSSVDFLVLACAGILVAYRLLSSVIL
jgi:hypothetical protein